MITIRKYLFLFCLVCVGIFILQFLYIIHLQNGDLKTDKFKHLVSEQSKTLKGTKTKRLVDFTVNDILDHMKHVRHGDFVTSNSSAEFSNFIRNKTKLSFQKEKLKVIVVPHSHNDPGYKKTYSEYFSEFTSKILSLAVEKLYKYHDMTFLWPETCFIERWWENQTKTTRNRFKHLVKSGRLELASGAWVIPDEATPHYFAYLDQMIEGHYWVKRHFNVMPEVSFDMDQFSLSSAVRHLMKEAGIKYSVVKRIHLGMKDYLMKEKLMNFYWNGLSDDISRDILFTHVEPYEWLSFPDSCGPSRSICEDLDLGHDIDLPVPGSPEADKPVRLLLHRYSNLGTFADKVVRQLKLKSSGYLHNVLLLPHGGDFRYDTSNDWDRQYYNMKILMQYINFNENYNIRIEFGTLKDYFLEVKMRSELHKIQYPIISGDFVPFALHLHYWSGFFTTRQYLKRLGRHLQESVRAADILTALLVISTDISGTNSQTLTSVMRMLVSARRELDLFQHHDAITGTADVNVVKDYETRLSSALFNTGTVLAFLANFVIRTKCINCDGRETADIDKTNDTLIQNRYDNLLLDFNHKHGILLEEVTTVVIYNPLPQERTETLTFSIHSPWLSITDPKGGNISFDFLSEEGKAIVIFNANLRPLSFSVFKIAKSQNSQSGNAMIVETPDTNHIGILVCETSEVKISFSAKNASPVEMCYKHDKFCTRLDIHWRHYIHTGGAYTMSLNNENKDVLGSEFKIRKVSGKRLCVVEVSHKLFKVEYILQNSTGLNGQKLHLNVYTDLSRTNSKDFAGEFAMRIVTQIKNGDTFYTDSNGFYLARRKFRQNLPFASNVYPMTSMAAIEDGLHVFTLHSAQPHGVVGWEPGTLDVMIDRVALREEMGLGQKVTDNKPTLSKLFLHFERNIISQRNGNVDMMTPSKESLQINDLLQHPFVSFMTTNHFPLKRRTFEFAHHVLPYEMSIANMKCLTNDEYTIDGISLTLHRRLAQSCKYSGENCAIQSNYSFDPYGLFRNISSKNWKIREMSLTHLRTKKELAPGEKVSFKNMDIKTLMFYN